MSDERPKKKIAWIVEEEFYVWNKDPQLEDLVHSIPVAVGATRKEARDVVRYYIEEDEKEGKPRSHYTVRRYERSLGRNEAFR